MLHPPLRYEGRDLEAMSFAQNYYHWVVDIFRPYLGRRTAEVGAGSGNFSSLLLSKNTEQLVCIEPSAEMYSLLIKKISDDNRVVPHQGLFTEISRRYPNYFDSIVYVNVLEHIEKDADELRCISSSLKIGGNVCIFVPALPWLYSDFDASVGHYRRYYKHQLEQLLREAGFEIVRSSYFDIAGIIPWFIVFKLFRRKLSAGNATSYDKLVVPFARIFESIFWIPIGKNIVIIAKKL